MSLRLVLILWAAMAGLGPAGLAGTEPRLVDPSVLEAESRRVEVMERAQQAVVAVFSGSGRGGGSGVVISPDGLALTNFHVAKPSGHWMKCGLPDGKLYDAVLVGLDPTGDVALIKLFGRDDFPSATLGDSDQVAPGDWVFVMGNPLLLATNLQPTVTYGIISGTHRYQYPAGTLLEYADCLQTDAAINPGNSGGPLFDDQGRLIGINGRCSFEKRGRVSVGVGYAVSINQIKNFLGPLASGRIVDHATLGFRVAFDEDGRVIVDEILDSSDAYRRGIRYGDEIVQFAGRSIGSPNALKNAVGIFPKGWRLPLGYRRAGKRHDIFVRLAGLHHESELSDKTEGRRPIQPPQGPKPPEKGPDKGPQPEGGKKRLPGKHGFAMPGLRAKPPVPAIVKKHYTAKHGYANYFFNRRNQERLWRGWMASAGDWQPSAPWTITGTIGTGKPFRIELDDQGGRMELPGENVKWTAGEDLAADLAPSHSGGLMPTLYLWRRLATDGLDRFGQIHYWGTAPLVGHERPADVLVGTHGGVTCRFYFDPDRYRLLALEMFPAEDVDPCEVYLGDYRSLEGRLSPGTMEVRFGDETYGRFSIEKFTTEPISPR